MSESPSNGADPRMTRTALLVIGALMIGAALVVGGLCFSLWHWFA